MLFLLILISLSSSVAFGQGSSKTSRLPCYYTNRIIPGGVLDLSNNNLMDSNGDSLSLIAGLPAEGGYNRLIIADCNHNGKKEFIYSGEGAVLYFIENEGAGNFTMADSISGCFYIPLMAGDLDGDNLTDLVVQEGNYVRVLESTSYITFPKTIVWSHILSSEYGEGRFEQYGQITDLDGDGRKEITMTTNTFPLFAGYGYISVFENVSDNYYTRIFYYGLNYPNSVLGYIATGDYDNNGKMEFACTAGINDSLYLFEAMANDSFRMKYKTFTGLTNQYPVITGNDLDNDGKKEIFVSGDNFTHPGYRNIKMFEAAGEDSYSLNTTITQYTGLIGFQPINTGNLFSSGYDELILEGHRIFIYNSAGNNTFILRDSSLFFFNATNAFCHDINQGSFDELQIVRTGGDILVFSNPYLTGLGNSHEYPVGYFLHQNYPNPFNPKTNIKYQISNISYVSLKVFDITGGIVAVLVEQKQSPGTYETNFEGSNYASGVYFYKLTAGEFTETRKMILMK